MVMYPTAKDSSRFSVAQGSPEEAAVGFVGRTLKNVNPSKSKSWKSHGDWIAFWWGWKEGVCCCSNLSFVQYFYFLKA